ncbi:hypothetical protein H4CHR_02743 [Variovorax sp. PBS-H4]|uniref:hypothetical protein n=1 Tax=Variovorax sp. PBS-H4 TaxID=434008 RepID=UPI001316C5B7|nr:hypothetical protein [Variovorax sp. PBS-H4]VTU31124.1 hypothetical protein H4CHR_02743 [Variovorax sp. PBS-H4]
MKISKGGPALNTEVQHRPKTDIDGLVLDFRNLSAENQKLLTDQVLDGFSPAEVARVFILRGKD